MVNQRNWLKNYYDSIQRLEPTNKNRNSVLLVPHLIGEIVFLNANVILRTTIAYIAIK
jgi:hypothetical protein